MDRKIAISLWRAVARSKPYRRNQRYFRSPDPDDIWPVPGEGWAVSYRLLGSNYGQVVLFIVGESGKDGRLVGHPSER